jgi:hypothetical protein
MFESCENRFADQEMPDVQLGELRDGGDRGDIVERQAVAGMRLDAVLGRKPCAVGDAVQFGGALLAVEMGEAPGVEFDDWHA